MARTCYWSFTHAKVGYLFVKVRCHVFLSLESPLTFLAAVFLHVVLDGVFLVSVGAELPFVRHLHAAQITDDSTLN